MIPTVERNDNWYNFLQDFYEYITREETIYGATPKPAELIERYLAQLPWEFTGNMDILKEHAVKVAKTIADAPDFKALYPPDPEEHKKREAFKTRVMAKQKEKK